MTRAGAPALYRGHTAHARRGPLEHRFRYAVQPWLVDLDRLPRLPRGLRWTASFPAADHVGDPSRSLRDNIAAVFTRESVDVTGCRLLMLANPRSAGHGFNPISVHWAVQPDGEIRGVVAEVHNTYGGRYAYVLRPDAAGRAETDKALYVSPFNGTDGRYLIRVSPPDDHIKLSVTLLPDDGDPFVATLQADRCATAAPAALALRSLGAAWRGSLLIRWEGIRLWARRLPVRPRPAGHDRELAQVGTRGTSTGSGGRGEACPGSPPRRRASDRRSELEVSR